MSSTDLTIADFDVHELKMKGNSMDILHYVALRGEEKVEAAAQISGLAPLSATKNKGGENPTRQSPRDAAAQISDLAARSATKNKGGENPTLTSPRDAAAQISGLAARSATKNKGGENPTLTSPRDADAQISDLAALSATKNKGGENPTLTSAHYAQQPSSEQAIGHSIVQNDKRAAAMIYDDGSELAGRSYEKSKGGENPSPTSADAQQLPHTSEHLSPQQAIGPSVVQPDKRVAAQISDKSEHIGSSSRTPPKRSEAEELANDIIKHVSLQHRATPPQPNLVIQKKLERSDLSTHYSRLSIPVSKIKCSFLDDVEKRLLHGARTNNKKNNYMEVEITGPLLETETVKLTPSNVVKKNGRKMHESYVLNGNWNSFAKKNKLKAGMVVQLFSFRLDRKLFFALIQHEAG